MHARGNTRLEAILDIVINSQIGVDQIIEIADDFACIFIQQSLQFAYIFEFVEELFKLGVEVLEDGQVVPKGHSELLLVHVLSINSGLLHLHELLTESLVELRHLLLVVFAEAGLLLFDDLVDLFQETCLVVNHGPIALRKNLAHQLRQVLKIVLTLLSALINLVVQEAKIAIEVVQLEEELLNETLLRLIKVLLGQKGNRLILCFFAVLLHRFRSSLFELFRDATFAERRVSAHADDGLGEVLLAETLLHHLVCLRKKHLLESIHCI